MSDQAANPETGPATPDDVVNLLVREQEAADTEAQGAAAPEPTPTTSDATDPDPPPAEPPAEPRYTVKVRGEEREVTLRELQDGYSRTEDYRAKTAEVAEQRRVAERERSEFAARAQQLDGLLQQAPFDPVLAQGQKTDWTSLARENPAEYVARDAEYKARLHYWQQVSQQAEHARVQTAQQRQAEGEKRMRELVPEWADDGKRKQLQAGIAKTLEAVGFTQDEYAGVTDPRVLMIARDAMLYRQMQSDRKAADAKRSAPPPPRTMAPGTTQANPTNSAAKALLKTAARTGRVDDQVNAILAAMES